jgi:urea transport system ATP-binding protein
MSLSLSGVNVRYGSSQVINDVNMDVPDQGVVCLLGRNGVGKTTLLKSIAGLLRLASGMISYNGRDLTRLAPDRIARLGMRLVLQDGNVFPGLTVAEHLQLGLGAVGKHRSGQLLESFPALHARLGQQVQTLSGGERKMLVIAQALASDPRLLLLDEPTEGVQPTVVQEIERVIQRVAAERAVVLVEQNIDVALRVGGYGYVMEKGRIVEQGMLVDIARKGLLHRYLVV